jgi:hypothetical protein
VLTSAASLIRLGFSNVETSSYFRPRLLAARLQSLSLLEELSIGFSIPIPRPSTERELLEKPGAPITLPRLKRLRFKGVSVHLESLVAQIRLPLLEHLDITLFNQMAFVLPHLSYLIDITESLKLSTNSAAVFFDHDQVQVRVSGGAHSWPKHFFLLCVICKQLDWQIDCAAQIYHTLIPALSGVERFTLHSFYPWGIPTELRNGAIDSTTWHELLRPFIGVKELHIMHGLEEEVSRALQVDEVGSDPGFLPNLQSIHASNNLFTSFLDRPKPLPNVFPTFLSSQRHQVHAERTEC